MCLKLANAELMSFCASELTVMDLCQIFWVLWLGMFYFFVPQMQRTTTQWHSGVSRITDEKILGRYGPRWWVKTGEYANIYDANNSKQPAPKQICTYFRLFFMPPPLGAGGIMFSGCPSVRPFQAWNTFFWPVHGCVGPSDQPWQFYGMPVYPSVRRSFRAFAEERMEEMAWNFACWCILTTFRTD